MQLNIIAKKSMSFLSGAQNFGAASYVQSLKKKKKRGVQLVHIVLGIMQLNLIANILYF